MKLLAVTLAAALLATAGLGGWILSGGEEATQASPAVSIGVDADPSGNTATSLGTSEPCIEKNTNDTFDIDIVIRDIADLWYWLAEVTYDPLVVQVIDRDVEMFLAASPGSEVQDLSTVHEWPGSPTTYVLEAKDLVEGATESGEGVLARLTLKAVGPGASPLSLREAAVIVDDIPVMLGPESVFSGQIAVDQECESDSDSDGWPDSADNCPDDPNPGQTDTDDDGLGNACDGDDDGDGIEDADDNCPLMPNPDQTDSDGDGIGDVCDISPTPGPSPTPAPGPAPGPTPTPTPGSSPTATPVPWPTPPPPLGTVYVVTGWNDSCYVGAEQPIEDALANIANDVLAVYRLGSDQRFERWFADRPTLSTITTVGPYDQLFILAARDAVWLHEPSDTLPTSVQLVSGWNSVCYAGEGKDIEAATAGIAGRFGVLYTLAPDQSWRRFVPGRPDVSNLNRLEPSISVLILVTDQGDVLWVFEP